MRAGQRAVPASFTPKHPPARFLFCPTGLLWANWPLPRSRNPFICRPSARIEIRPLPSCGRGLRSYPRSIPSPHDPRIAVRDSAPAAQLWDNLHAMIGDLRRLYLGPYAGRPLELRGEISGVLTNPNCQFEANFIPIRTLRALCQGAGALGTGQGLSRIAQAWLPALPATARAERRCPTCAARTRPDAGLWQRQRRSRGVR